MAFSTGFGPALDAIKKSAGDLLKAIGFDFEDDPAGGIYKSAKTQKIFKDGVPWSYSGQDWYKVFPYSFVVEWTSGKGSWIYTLPIPPQSMLTKMIPASAATATLGGVVEETSDNVFWVIQMAGTTGVAISREGVDNPDSGSRKEMAKKFRKKLETTGLLSGVAAQLNTLVGKTAGTADAVISGIQSGSITGAIGGVVGAINNAILPSLPYSGSAVDDVTNGYTEIQELHRFLFTFSHLKSLRPDRYRLKFKNYKTGQEWRVIIQDFSIQQSAQNPHLYRYNIQLKAWDVKPIDAKEREDKEFDRFGPEGDLKAVNTVGAEGAYKAFKAFSKTFKGGSNSATKNTIEDSIEASSGNFASLT